MSGSALDVGCETEAVQVGAGVWRPLHRRLPLGDWPGRNEHPITLTGLPPGKRASGSPFTPDAMLASQTVCSLYSRAAPEGFVAESMNVARLPRARHVRRPRLASPAVITVTPE